MVWYFIVTNGTEVGMGVPPVRPDGFKASRRWDTPRFGARIPGARWILASVPCSRSSTPDGRDAHPYLGSGGRGMAEVRSCSYERERVDEFPLAHSRGQAGDLHLRGRDGRPARPA